LESHRNDDLHPFLFHAWPIETKMHVHKVHFLTKNNHSKII
jgi:hypothetical protein